MPKLINTSTDACEQIVRSLVKSETVTITELFIAIGNAFSFGEICEHVDEVDLQDMHNHFAALREIGKKYD